MKRHLFEKKKECPGQLADIELTIDIKECILQNRVYKAHPPPAPTQPNNTQINIIKAEIQSQVRSADIIGKLKYFHRMNNSQLINFSDHVESELGRQAINLNTGKLSQYYLDIDDIINIVDQITTCQEVEKMCLALDNVNNKIYIHDNGEWQAKIFGQGIKTILTALKETFFDYYECYLIRKIEDPTTDQGSRNIFKDRIDTYYRLLFALDIQPYIIGKSDKELLYAEDSDDDDDDVYNVQEKYYERYQKQMRSANNEKKVARHVESLVKGNLKKGVQSLNEAIQKVAYLPAPLPSDNPLVKS
jgi:hypothetical protein